jgi:hypothetical protein
MTGSQEEPSPTPIRRYDGAKAKEKLRIEKHQDREEDDESEVK